MTTPASVKEKFPDEAALVQGVKKDIAAITQSIKAEIGHLEADYVQIKRTHRLAGGLIGGWVVSIIILLGFGEVLVDVGVSTGLIVVLLLVVVVGLLLTGKKLYKMYTAGGPLIREFESKVNQIVFARALTMLGLTGSYLEHTYEISAESFGGVDDVREFLTQQVKKHGSYTSITKESQQVLALLDHAELVTEARNHTHIDDMVTINMGGRSLFISELDIKNITGSGKNRKVKKIFRGYFASFDLPRTLEGKTFVSTEGDKKGFGHLSFWKSKKKDGVRETKLEWNEFEKLLHVATNNESEARYVLPPDFMADLYDWWQHKKQNIRVSFIANRMYLLFPDSNIRIKSTVPNLDEAHIEVYLLSIAKPLLHVVHLVEDVTKQFRR